MLPAELLEDELGKKLQLVLDILVDRGVSE